MNLDWFARLEWSNKKTIEGKSFDELFTIDGISLWWFYHRFFVPWVMPKQVNAFTQMNEKKELSTTQKTKMHLASKILSKGVYYNERKKITFFSNVENQPRGDVSSQNEDRKPSALFLSYTNHISNDNKIFRFEQILRNLATQSEVERCLIFVDPLSKKTFKSLKKRRTIYQYFTPKIHQKALQSATKMHDLWKKITPLQKQKMLTVDGNDYWRYVRYGFNLYMSKEFLYLLHCYYELFKKAIKEQNVKVCLVTGVSSLHERCLMAAAKYHKIKTIFIEHGLLLHGTPTDPKILYDTTMAVFSQNFKESLIQVGVNENNIKVVGPVVYDEIFKYMKTKQGTKKRIFIATSPVVEINYCEQQEYFTRVKKMLEQVASEKFDEIVIKLHPREIHLQEYEKIATELDLSNVKVLRDISRKEYYRLINESDYFVHFGSNSSIEAIILDKPVLLVNMLDDTRLTSWVEKFKIMPIVSYKDNVKKALENLEEDKKERDMKRKEFVAKYIGSVDGLASKRVADMILKTARKK